MDLQFAIFIELVIQLNVLVFDFLIRQLCKSIVSEKVPPISGRWHSEAASPYETFSTLV
jgi:hypothetical protein